jgi:cell division septation protein DedD
MADLAFVKSRIKQFIFEKALPESVAPDIELWLMNILDENNEPANVRELDAWLEARPHLHSPDTHRSPVNKIAERKSFDINATLLARSDLMKEYGATMYAERMAAWGCSPGSLKAGTEPGKPSKEKPDAQADLERSNSPFSPTKIYKTPEARQAEIAKYIVQFGAKSAARAAQKFGVDLAGRPIQRRAF